MDSQGLRQRRPTAHDTAAVQPAAVVKVPDVTTTNHSKEEQRHSSHKKDTKGSKSHEKSPPASSFPSVPQSTEGSGTEISRLWLDSRLLTESERNDPKKKAHGRFRRKGEDRPYTMHNVALAYRLLYLMAPKLVELFWVDGEKMAFVGWILGAHSQLRTSFEKSFTSESVDRYEVLWAAATSLALNSFETIYRHLVMRTNRKVMDGIDNRVKRLFLQSKLSLSLPALSHHYMSALVEEAGVFAGTSYREREYGSTLLNPSSEISDVVNLFSGCLELVTQFTLISQATSSASASLFDFSTFILLGLAVAPSVVTMPTKWFVGKTRQRMQASRRNLRRQLSEAEWNITNSIENKVSLQETIIYGLKDWILERWDAVTAAKATLYQAGREVGELWTLGTTIFSCGVGDVFYVLLALQALPTRLSLGSIQLYQNASHAFLQETIILSNTFREVFQTIFFLAAFCEFMDLPEESERRYRHQAIPLDAPLIDYECVREHRRMAIEAKNLGYSYPYATKPVLNGINLSIAPGETLAIVGFNGSGKTTLSKVLMGLYEHTGDLLINGRPIEAYSPASVHRRTACLFQDFQSYRYTLRENVGMGSLQHMMDDERIEQALTQGGAKGIKDKIGLDTKLHMYRLSREDNEDTTTDGKDVDKDGKEKEVQPKSQTGENDPAKSSMVKTAWHALVRMITRVHILTTGNDLIEQKEDEVEKDNSKWLSGGQWQRVALARAFLRSDEADLVVFDEPSSSLDPRAEYELFQRIHSLSRQGDRKVTTIYVSHRFSTVRKADKIAVVEQGTITELGSHDDLMRLEGRYFELFNLSKEGFNDPGPNPVLAETDSSKSGAAEGADGNTIGESEVRLPPTPVSPRPTTTSLIE